MIEPDPWRERLSPYLDDELTAIERSELEAHLVTCTSCTRALGELDALVRAARALPTLAPERDLWPGLRAALETPMSTRSFPRWPLAFAAGVLVALAAVFAFERRSRSSPPSSPPRAREGVEVAERTGESYLLLLHEPEGFLGGRSREEQAAIVERYARWASELGERCLGGEELERGGFELHPGANQIQATGLAAGEQVGGYFLVQVRDREEALALGKSCPHLEQGGWIELRRIQTRQTSKEK